MSSHGQDHQDLIFDEKGGKSPGGGTPRSGGTPHSSHRLRLVASKLQDFQVSLPTCVWEDPGTPNDPSK